MLDLVKKETENEREYIWRIGQYVLQGKTTWIELAPVINKNCRDNEEEYRTESAYRKQFQNANNYYTDVFSKMINNEYHEMCQEDKRELERLKIQFRDERNAWNKQNYIDARVEQKLDLLEDVIKNINPVAFTPNYTCGLSKDNTMVICLSDLHIGACYDNFFGRYNSDIAKERLEQYLVEISELQSIYKCENAYIFLMGDLISGNIHLELAVTNRENVIQQVCKACEYITEFSKEVSKIFNGVFISSVDGNHSRLTMNKKEAVKDERLDSFIPFYLKASLSPLNNVEILDNTFDNTLSSVEIDNNMYYICHGDYDKFSSTGISALTTMTGIKPKAVFFGHYHTCALSDEQGVKLIRGGSLGGSGDSYTVTKRIYGKPSQMVCILNKKGVKSCHPIDLD